MTLSQIRRAYQDAFRAHQLNVQAYAEGRIAAETLRSSREELRRLQAQHDMEAEHRKLFGRA